MELGFTIKDLESRILDLRYRIWNLRSRISDIGYRTSNLSTEFRSSVFLFKKFF